MIRSNKILLLIITLVVILILFYILYYFIKDNYISNNKENFTASDKEYNTSDLFSVIKNNTLEFKEYIVLDDIIEYLDNKLNDDTNGIISKINAIKNSIETKKNNSPMDLLPIGTILMWNKDKLPLDKDGNESSKWVWCNGENRTPNFSKAMPLGDNNGSVKLPEDEVNKIIDKDEDTQIIIQSKITENNFPEHIHETESVSSYSHNHSINNFKDSIFNIPFFLFQYGSYSRDPHTIHHPSTAQYPNDNNPQQTPTKIEHTHTLSNQNAHTHNEDTTKRIISYGSDEQKDNIIQEEFYPRISNINFIMKIM